MKYRAICSDIDGTLLDSRRELSARTISTIKSLPKEIPFILASSRMPSAMVHLQAELGILNSPIICFNGGYVVHQKHAPLTSIIFDSVFIGAAICKSIVSLAAGTDIHVSLYAEDTWYAPHYDKWTEREERITKARAVVTSLDEVLNDWLQFNKGAHKVMCMGPEHEIEEMQNILNSRFSNDIHVYRSRPTYLELAPKSISKASGLSLILERVFNIHMEDVVAFGDNYNDIDLLQSAGLGVAVGNARDEVKAVAKEITLNSVDDGVAFTIEKYFLR